ncbi:MAG: 23S rRNA (guanosine(2251)-2'-O)-methyltransferase RlmB [Firmicutes bacterium]|nr:23S rRNA (guanosine(2251)-2'-O)-methyltransferase RlmB [Bacillota bacterium]
MSGNIISGRNAVTEALKSGRHIDKIYMVNGAEGSAKKIAAMAKERRIPVVFKDRKALDRMADGAAHQGVIAQSAPYSYAEVSDILENASSKGESPFIIILDGIEDPHNLGAIMRSAEGAGAHGVIIPKRRAAELTDTAVKASAGAAEYMPCARVTNIARTIDELKEKGVWIWGCDMGGENYSDADLSGGIALVIGNEGKGISRIVREKCDFTVSIPMRGRIESLNASNAAAVLMYEIDRRRHK